MTSMTQMISFLNIRACQQHFYFKTEHLSDKMCVYRINPMVVFPQSKTLMLLNRVRYGTEYRGTRLQGSARLMSISMRMMIDVS